MFLCVEVAVFRASSSFKSKFNFYQNESMRGNVLTGLCTKVVQTISRKISEIKHHNTIFNATDGVIQVTTLCV